MTKKLLFPFDLLVTQEPDIILRIPIIVIASNLIITFTVFLGIVV